MALSSSGVYMVTHFAYALVDRGFYGLIRAKSGIESSKK